MEEIKAYVFSICVLLICGFILNLLLSKDDYRKILKIVISVFILSSMISPLLSIKNKINLPDTDFEHGKIEDDFSEELIQNTEADIENNLKEKCGTILNNNDILFNNISIEIKINGNSDIEILEFSVETSASEETKVKKIIKENFGFEPEIIFTEE